MLRYFTYLTVLAVFLIKTAAFGQTLFWDEEAENGTLSGNAVVAEGCANASEGKFVKLLWEEGNALQFSSVEIPSTDTYLLKIYYYYVGVPPVEIWVNNDSLGVFEFPSVGWCYNSQGGEYLLPIDLVAGTNVIEFRATLDKPGPFLDKLEIKSAAPPEISLRVSANRLKAGQEVQLKVEALDPVLFQESVQLEVSGILEHEFEMLSTTLIIEAGSKEASTTFLYINEQALEVDTAIISLKNPSAGIVLGDADSVQIVVNAFGANYYISSVLGDDNNDGLSPEFPWKTMEKAETYSFIPGDSILFKRGDTFVGQLKFKGSGFSGAPIVVGSYGEGASPHIDGAHAEGGAYEAAIWIENQEFIEIENLEISNDRTVARPGVADYNANGIMVLNSGDRIMHHIVCRNLNIHDIYALSLDGIEFNKIKVAGITFKSLPNNEVGKEKNIQDVLVEDCYFKHTARLGITTGHGGSSSGLGNDSINRNMNLVFRNNHFYELGGSGIVPGRSYNCLIEYNTFEYCGSNVDPRMAARGSGAWFWSCRNVIAQYNKSLHIRGNGDSYGMHIDFGNRNIILQYNYSEDSEGGFVEILGKNVNSVYRFNVSVNDGIRNFHGNSLWVSTYAGEGNRIPSDSNFIYNNTIYVDADITPDILIEGENTFVYNNIFYATGRADIGLQTKVLMYNDAVFTMANNLFYGNVSNAFSSYDASPVFGNPLFQEPGLLNVEGYKLLEGSLALDAGTSFPEPEFPMAGKGIFKDVKMTPDTDLYGNAVHVSATIPHIGAYNGIVLMGSNVSTKDAPVLTLYPNPASAELRIKQTHLLEAMVYYEIMNISGKTVSKGMILTDNDRIQVSHLETGIYVIHISTPEKTLVKRFIKQ